ncbi:MAG TPA: cytochrome c [Quisquiliibacterium sp.]|nr:cytochrome c [Quisquiliibacterium sp.]HQN13805.1 cytochrome c [Quisquiliibacterium sp.]
MNKLTVTLSAVAVAASALFATPAAAQFAKAEDAIKYRKSAFTVLGAHFGRIGAVVKGERPFNAAEVQANAAVVETLSTLPWAAFGAGTDKGETRAKPEIWTSADKFKGGADQMQKAVAALSVAAKSGNLDQVKAAFGEAGKTCKGCHDNFRKD